MQLTVTNNAFWLIRHKRPKYHCHHCVPVCRSGTDNLTHYYFLQVSIYKMHELKKTYFVFVLFALIKFSQYEWLFQAWFDSHIFAFAWCEWSLEGGSGLVWQSSFCFLSIWMVPNRRVVFRPGLTVIIFAFAWCEWSLGGVLFQAWFDSHLFALAFHQCELALTRRLFQASLKSNFVSRDSIICSDTGETR